MKKRSYEEIELFHDVEEDLILLVLDPLATSRTRLGKTH